MPVIICLNDPPHGDEVITQRSIDRLPDGHKFLAKPKRALIESIYLFFERVKAGRSDELKIQPRAWHKGSPDHRR